ncbi:hypothetical protein HY251_03240 [bacterium]|nr:hypothetical protein [bacterium]
MRVVGALACLLGALGGCRTADPPEVQEPAGGEVTVFVHGMKGSFLVTEDGERAWLEASDLLSSGERSLALPPGGEERFGPLHPRGVLTRFTLFPVLATADVYLPWLEYGKERLPGFVPFVYDWRIDAREAVLSLARRIEALAAKRRGDLRVNLVGHSLGGLVALAYVRYGGGDPERGITWAGARFVKRLVLAGAPFGGSPSFLRDILLGDKIGRNVRLLAPEAMASFVPSYEILPQPGTFFVGGDGAPLARDVDDAKTWESLRPGRRPPAGALEARLAFRKALAASASAPEPPGDLAVLVVSGTGRPTIRRVLLARPDDLGSADFRSSPTTSGDGRVTEESSLPPGPLVYSVVKTPADHVGLLNDETVQEAIRSFFAR